MKTLRNISAFIVGFIIISLIYSLIHYTFVKSYEFLYQYKFWTIVLLVLLGSFISAGIVYLGVFVNKILLKISNSNKSNTIIIFIACLINFILEVRLIWTLDVEYTSEIRVASFVYTFILFTFSSIFVVGSTYKQNKD